MSKIAQGTPHFSSFGGLSAVHAYQPHVIPNKLFHKQDFSGFCKPANECDHYLRDETLVTGHR